MLKLKMFIFIYLYIFSLEEIIVNIVDGTYSYTFEKGTYYNFTFNAVNDGNYAIIFPGEFYLFEATGNLNEEVNVDYGFYSYIYAQNFVKGNYFKLTYPLFTFSETKIQKVRIEKIDAYLKLMITGTVIFTLAFNDCKNLYIFLHIIINQIIMTVILLLMEEFILENLLEVIEQLNLILMKR